MQRGCMSILSGRHRTKSEPREKLHSIHGETFWQINHKIFNYKMPKSTGWSTQPGQRRIGDRMGNPRSRCLATGLCHPHPSSLRPQQNQSQGSTKPIPGRKSPCAKRISASGVNRRETCRREWDMDK